MQGGSDPERRVQLLTRPGQTHAVLVLSLHQRVDEALIRRLDELLRPYESTEPYLRRPHTYPETAELLGVSTKWLQRRVRRRAIPYRQVGGYVRFLGVDIDFIRDQMARGLPEGPQSGAS